MRWVRCRRAFLPQVLTNPHHCSGFRLCGPRPSGLVGLPFALCINGMNPKRFCIRSVLLHVPDLSLAG